MSGLFIAFEGADGCGKSTQMRFLAEYLQGEGLSVITTREPGGCLVAEKIRDILLDNANSEMTAETEALLYAAARAEHVRHVIKPAVDSGKVVLCDRYIYSSIAYQGYGRQLDIDTVWQINLFAVSGYMPDVTLFLDIPPERGFERMHKRASRDRLESAGLSFHQRAWDGFQKLSQRDDVMTIGAAGTKYETHEIIINRLKPVFQEAGLL